MKRTFIGIALATLISVALGLSQAIAQNANDTIGVIEQVSEQNRTLTIDGKVYRYTGGTKMLQLDGKASKTFDLRWLGKSTTVAYKARESKPHPVLVFVQPFGL